MRFPFQFEFASNRHGAAQRRLIEIGAAAGIDDGTAIHDGEQHGMTVTSFTSVSLEPPLIIISLQDSTRTRELVYHAQAFGVTILSADQAELSERFAGRTADSDRRRIGLRMRLDLSDYFSGEAVVRGLTERRKLRGLLGGGKVRTTSLRGLRLGTARRRGRDEARA